MRLSRVRIKHPIIIGLVVVGLLLFCRDVINAPGLADKYRRKAEYAAQMERRCREIEAMDPVTRAHATKEASDSFNEFSYVYLSDPEWNRRMIPYFEAMRIKYEYLAEHPRLPVPPDPPAPK